MNRMITEAYIKRTRRRGTGKAVWANPRTTCQLSASGKASTGSWIVPQAQFTRAGASRKTCLKVLYEGDAYISAGVSQA